MLRSQSILSQPPTQSAVHFAHCMRRPEREGRSRAADVRSGAASLRPRGQLFFVREVNLINNRQGGRRRGRGGQRGPNLGGQPGNRQDNRQRGNAAQLLEKYKSMARDSQLAGDRVQTEYYLQYADHYFRVLNENRARFEEQRPRARRFRGRRGRRRAARGRASPRTRATTRPSASSVRIVATARIAATQRDRRPRERNRYDGDDQAARRPGRGPRAPSRRVERRR